MRLRYQFRRLLIIVFILTCSVASASSRFPEVEGVEQGLLARFQNWLPNLSDSISDFHQQGRYMVSEWTGIYQGATDLSGYAEGELSEQLESLKTQICYLGTPGPLLSALHLSGDLYYFGNRVLNWDEQVNNVLVSEEELPDAGRELLMGGSSRKNMDIEPITEQPGRSLNESRVSCFGVELSKWRQIGNLLRHYGFLSSSQGFTAIVNKNEETVVRLGGSRVLAFSPNGHQRAGVLAVELGRMDNNDFYLLGNSPEAYHVRADTLPNYASYGYARYVEIVRIEDIFPSYYGQFRNMFSRVSLGGVAATTATVLVLGKLFAGAALSTTLMAGLSLGVLLPIVAHSALDSWTIYDTSETWLPLVTMQSMFGSALNIGGKLVSYLGAGVSLVGQGMGQAVQKAPHMSLITGAGALLGVIFLPYGVPFGTLLTFGTVGIVATGAGVGGLGLLAAFMYMNPSYALSATNSLWNRWNGHQN